MPTRAGIQLTAFLILLSALLTSIPGPTTSLRGDEGRTVTFRADGLPNPTNTDIVAITQREVLRSFYDQYPQYDIEPFTMPIVGGTSEMDVGPLMAISAGIPPHAIYVNFRQSSTYIEQGFLEPLEVMLARIRSDDERVRRTDERDNWLADPTPGEIEEALELIRERVPEPSWPVVYREDLSGRSDEKHVWAIPTSNLVQALLYRKDVFSEAGLNPERPPQNWDEMIEFARILRVPERRQYGMLFGAGHGTSYQAYSFMVSKGARAQEQDEDGNWRAAFDSREAAEGIYFFWRLIREPFTRDDGRVINGAAGLTTGPRDLEWERGNVGMQFSYLDEQMLAAINPQQVGIAPVPVTPEGLRGSEVNARMMGIFSGSKPEQKLAVMRYLWYITSDEAHRLRTRIFVENGYGMFVNPEYLERFGYERVLRRVPPGWREAFQTAMENGVPEPYGAETMNIYRWMSRPINRALEDDFAGMTDDEAISVIQGYLEETVEEFNLKVLGLIPPEQMQQRRWIGAGVILIIAIVFSLGMAHVWRYFSRVSAPVTGQQNWRRYAWGYLLLIPGIGLVLTWQYFPLIMGGASISFMDYRVVQDSLWVGVDNFANTLFDEQFWRALLRTFYFVTLSICLGFWPPIALAILLQEVPTNTAKYIFRTIYYLPAVLIGVVVMFLWRQLYDPSEQGVLNQLLLSLNNLGPGGATLLKLGALGIWGSIIYLLFALPIRLGEMPRGLKITLWVVGLAFLGLTLSPLFDVARNENLGAAFALLGNVVGTFDLEPLRWTQSPDIAMLCVVVPMIWASMGPGCILYLAALKSVPNDLYEAAEIDGAGNWHKVFYIILPRLKYLIVIQFVWAVIVAFRGGEEFILIMTGGGPGEATTILSLEIFFRTFVELNFGEGTAMAWMMGALLIAFTAYQLKLLSNAEFRAGG